MASSEPRLVLQLTPLPLLIAKAVNVAEYFGAKGTRKKPYGHDAYKQVRHSKKTGKTTIVQVQQKGAKAPAQPAKEAKPSGEKKPLLKWVFGKKMTLADLPKGYTLSQATGLQFMGYPARDVDPKAVAVDLTGDVHSHIVLRWTNAKGNEKVGYTRDFAMANADEKWSRVEKLVKAYPGAVKKLRAIWTDKKESVRTRDAAAALWVITQTGLRHGTKDAYDKKKGKHRGTCTLHKDDVTVKGDTVLFSFTGKEGVHNKAAIQDAEFAKYIAARQVEGQREHGNHQFLWNSMPYQLDAGKEPMMERVGLGEFKVHDVRTMLAGRWAVEAIGAATPPPPPLPEKPSAALKMLKEKLKSINEMVAGKLNDTPKTAKGSYINPCLIRAWLAEVGAGEYVTKLAKSLSAEVVERIWQRALAMPTPHARKLSITDEEEADIEEYPLPFDDSSVSKSLLTEHPHRQKDYAHIAMVRGGHAVRATRHQAKDGYTLDAWRMQTRLVITGFATEALGPDDSGDPKVEQWLVDRGIRLPDADDSITRRTAGQWLLKYGPTCFALGMHLVDLDGRTIASPEELPQFVDKGLVITIAKAGVKGMKMKHRVGAKPHGTFWVPSKSDPWLFGVKDPEKRRAFYDKKGILYRYFGPGEPIPADIEGMSQTAFKKRIKAVTAHNAHVEAKVEALRETVEKEPERAWVKLTDAEEALKLRLDRWRRPTRSTVVQAGHAAEYKEIKRQLRSGYRNEQQPRIDENGRPVLDEKGKPIVDTVKVPLAYDVNAHLDSYHYDPDRGDDYTEAQKRLKQLRAQGSAMFGAKARKYKPRKGDVTMFSGFGDGYRDFGIDPATHGMCYLLSVGWPDKGRKKFEGETFTLDGVTKKVAASTGNSFTKEHWDAIDYEMGATLGREVSYFAKKYQITNPDDRHSMRAEAEDALMWAAQRYDAEVFGDPTPGANFMTFAKRAIQAKVLAWVRANKRYHEAFVLDPELDALHEDFAGNRGKTPGATAFETPEEATVRYHLASATRDALDHVLVRLDPENGPFQAAVVRSRLEMDGDLEGHINLPHGADVPEGRTEVGEIAYRKANLGGVRSWKQVVANLLQELPNLAITPEKRAQYERMLNSMKATRGEHKLGQVFDEALLSLREESAGLTHEEVATLRSYAQHQKKYLEGARREVTGDEGIGKLNVRAAVPSDETLQQLKGTYAKLVRQAKKLTGRKDKQLNLDARLDITRKLSRLGASIAHKLVVEGPKSERASDFWHKQENEALALDLGIATSLGYAHAEVAGHDKKGNPIVRHTSVSLPYDKASWHNPRHIQAKLAAAELYHKLYTHLAHATPRERKKAVEALNAHLKKTRAHSKRASRAMSDLENRLDNPKTSPEERQMVVFKLDQLRDLHAKAYQDTQQYAGEFAGMMLKKPVQIGHLQRLLASTAPDKARGARGEAHATVVKSLVVLDELGASLADLIEENALWTLNGI